ncbi:MULTISPECIES: urease accessory protein UreE [Acinetobacter]|jgi:urease accessory protein|uniref:Urease accessory protein UreE n=1 Tax=Acinetobacter radioresistens SK82 TaxID=596318 RepID=A0ABM9YRX8_ACIRA|nr:MULTISPECIES: urease accessory protein UreE [Acinetobacter]EET83917.1 urease accessory protein UreE domain protein [Acinetobacter radioresistens SK82]EEY86970.1 urease accessory protein UreE domain protein [Acinetobacter radioresistens SH164]EJO35413.1 urease accessory protein UreE [Acinetobacter radioresistens WC-A-157]EXE57272.1 urease accessory protein ureE [Acinetobacter sp. 1239920]MBA5698248.1 urease accessory protein UreE [Acinetobacter radioresistens]
MKIYTQRLETIHHNSSFEIVELTFDTRQKSRFRATLNSGIDIGADLPRTGILRSGSFIATEQGDILRIDAKPERLMQVIAQSDFDLVKAAYHLGNRHVPLMLTPSALYFEPDHVLAEMVTGLGLTVAEIEHPFEPESGAYAQHSHEHRLSPIKALHAHGHH